MTTFHILIKAQNKIPECCLRHFKNPEGEESTHNMSPSKLLLIGPF